MTPTDRIRAIALTLPEVEERPGDGQSTFLVAGTDFAQVRTGGHGDERDLVCVRTSGADEQRTLIEAAPDVYSRPIDPDAADWITLNLAGEPDWQLVDYRIARSWELAAPDRLLEAGGR